VDEWIEGWMDGEMDMWVDKIAVLRIPYSNQKLRLNSSDP
jgi:hypothetical protein